MNQQSIAASSILDDARTARLTIHVLQEALKNATNEQAHFLATYLSAEAASRKQSSIRRLLQGSHLPQIKTLDTYDWGRVILPEGLTKEALINLDFTTNHEDLICYGDVGCGKTHLAQALIRQACLTGIRARFTTAADLIMTLRKAKTKDTSTKNSPNTPNSHSWPSTNSDTSP